VAERNGKAYKEEQLDFAFVSELSEISVAPPDVMARPRASRTPRPRGLGPALAAAQEALLDASLRDVDAHLLSLFEFCEAALTRALDVVPARKEHDFSAEEQRSLRGIGQAQWLMSEAHAKRALRADTGPKEKKGKK
jgi:hypothetical protein